MPRFTSHGKPIEVFATRGNGGQCAFVFPTLGLVVVITAGNYNQFQGGRQLIPHRLIAEYVLPSAGIEHVELVVRQSRGLSPTSHAYGAGAFPARLTPHVGRGHGCTFDTRVAASVAQRVPS